MISLILLLGVVTFVVHRLLKLGSRPPNFPPGPPTQPVFGNLRQEHIFRKWAKQYGAVFSIMKGSVPYIVVNEQNAAHELFNKLGQSTSARPDLPTQLITRGGYAPSAMNGQPWRTARGQWHGMLNVSATKKYLQYQTLEATKFLYDMVATTEDWQKHIPRYSNSVSLSMTAGHRVTDSKDPIVTDILETFGASAQYNMRYNWSNFFPFLFKLPTFLPGPRKEGLKVFEERRQRIIDRYRDAQKKTLPSFFQAIADKQGDLGLSDYQAANLGEILLGAGTETTANSLHAWFAAMAQFPEVQRKAQDEIDRVVGKDRLPSVEDEVDLVYVRQVLQELHRWFTVAPLGLTHAASKPLEWRGYKIPEGTGLIFNTMAIHYDEKLYPQPELFIPERWEGKLKLAAEGSLGATSELFTFGAGRRICPGQHLAERSLFILISYCLWALNIEKARDEAGNEVPIDTHRTKPGLARMFFPFEVSIKPRSQEKEDIVLRTWATMKEELLTADEQWKNSPKEVHEVIDKVKTQRQHS